MHSTTNSAYIKQIKVSNEASVSCNFYRRIKHRRMGGARGQVRLELYAFPKSSNPPLRSAEYKSSYNTTLPLYITFVFILCCFLSFLNKMIILSLKETWSVPPKGKYTTRGEKHGGDIEKIMWRWGVKKAENKKGGDSYHRWLDEGGDPFSCHMPPYKETRGGMKREMVTGSQEDAVNIYCIIGNGWQEIH